MSLSNPDVTVRTRTETSPGRYYSFVNYFSDVAGPGAGSKFEVLRWRISGGMGVESLEG